MRCVTCGADTDAAFPTCQRCGSALSSTPVAQHAYLRTLKKHVADFEDPDRAGHEVAAIEAARAQQQPDRQRVLASLATLATVSGTLANAVDGATETVSQGWPF